ncbi:hypothetical protein [Synechococcus sp. MU1625]|uniref:hypothetical protein n=1 Tax=Synechococcus sp. MU1625 TaxID=2508347 RepID=UPI001CF8E051|nr:hypothetical protein [Synechococcus sp. MU1625]
MNDRASPINLREHLICRVSFNQLLFGSCLMQVKGGGPLSVHLMLCAAPVFREDGSGLKCNFTVPYGPATCISEQKQKIHSNLTKPHRRGALSGFGLRGDLQSGHSGFSFFLTKSIPFTSATT